VRQIIETGNVPRAYEMYNLESFDIRYDYNVFYLEYEEKERTNAIFKEEYLHKDIEAAAEYFKNSLFDPTETK
jgi:hypothetical protein